MRERILAHLLGESLYGGSQASQGPSRFISMCQAVILQRFSRPRCLLTRGRARIISSLRNCQTTRIYRRIVVSLLWLKNQQQNGQGDDDSDTPETGGRLSELKAEKLQHV